MKILFYNNPPYINCNNDVFSGVEYNLLKGFLTKYNDIKCIQNLDQLNNYNNFIAFGGFFDKLSYKNYNYTNYTSPIISSNLIAYNIDSYSDIFLYIKYFAILLIFLIILIFTIINYLTNRKNNFITHFNQSFTYFWKIKNYKKIQTSYSLNYTILSIILLIIICYLFYFRIFMLFTNISIHNKNYCFENNISFLSNNINFNYNIEKNLNNCKYILVEYYNYLLNDKYKKKYYDLNNLNIKISSFGLIKNNNIKLSNLNFEINKYIVNSIFENFENIQSMVKKNNYSIFQYWDLIMDFIVLFILIIILIIIFWIFSNNNNIELVQDINRKKRLIKNEYKIRILKIINIFGSWLKNNALETKKYIKKSLKNLDKN